MIDGPLAGAIGVQRVAPPEIVAEYLIRHARVSAPADEIPVHAAEWFIILGNKLAGQASVGSYGGDPPRRCLKPFADIAADVAEEAVVVLHRKDAPAVLAAISPLQVVGGCEAKDLAKVCRALVKRHLAGFCLQILRSWEYDGTIYQADDEASGF